ncbi:Tat pathway signal protein [Brevundimonas sp.]|uniref:Tat pathway signal protein n=1 Tax=Brevundimonas sp. TaxID=1871086 RepID=UPI0035B3D013
MDRRALLGLAAVAVSVPSAAAASGGGGGAAPQATFMRLPTITGSVSGASGRRAVMSVEVGLDVQDAALRTRATQSAPRLRAAYNTVVQRVASTTLPGMAPDVERLVAELQAATNATLGRAGARLLIGTVMVV